MGELIWWSGAAGFASPRVALELAAVRAELIAAKARHAPLYS